MGGWEKEDMVTSTEVVALHHPPLNAHTPTPAVPLSPTPMRCSKVKRKDATLNRKRDKRPEWNVGKARGQTWREDLDRQWSGVDEQRWELEEVVSIWFVFEHFSDLIKCPLNCAVVLGRCFVCEMLYGALMKGDTMQRWQRVISLCRRWFICVSVQCDRDGKKMSQWQDVNHRQDGGFVSWKPTLSFYFSLLCSSVLFTSSLSLSVHLLVDGGVERHKWRDGGRSWPPFIPLSLCLSVFSIFCCLSFRWGFESLWRRGCVLSTNHGLRLNPKCPLREPVRWEEGMECGWWVGGWRNISASIH